MMSPEEFSWRCSESRWRIMQRVRNTASSLVVDELQNARTFTQITAAIRPVRLVKGVSHDRHI